ncbi:MAG: MFS transporter [Deltaproteobacteria bacterium]|nr:MFS transporter [Deltaproteobacteria bacterium]
MDIHQRGKIFTVLFFSIFAAMLGLGIILPILPLYAETIGAGGLWLGAIFAGFSLSRSCCMPIVGKLSDRWGRKGFIATGLLVYSLSSLGYVYASNAAELVLVRIVQGACSAMIVPIAMAYIGDITPPDREGSYMGRFTMSLFLGFGFGPILGGLIKDAINVDAAFVGMGILCSLAFVLVVCWLPPGHGTGAAGRGESSSYRTILRCRQLQGVLCYRFVSSFARASVLTFLPLYASRELGLSASLIGLLVAAGVLSASFLQYPFGKLADRVNRKILIVAGSLCYASTLVFFPFADTFWQLLGLSLLMGVTGAVSLPAATALIVERGRTFGMGSSMAVFNVAMSLGLGCGPLVSGIIFDAGDLALVFYAAAGLGILGTAVAGYLLAGSPPTGTAATRVVEDI